MSFPHFLRNRKVHIHITCASIIFTCTTFRQLEKRLNDISVCWTFNVADLSHIEPLRTSRKWSIIKYLFYACAFPWVMACQSISDSLHVHEIAGCSSTSKDDDEYFMHFTRLSPTVASNTTNNALDRQLTDGNNRNRCEFTAESIATCNLIRGWWIARKVWLIYLLK